MKKVEAGDRVCVLVGTYRLENADWIKRKKLYNLPIAEAGDAAAFGKFTSVVLYAADAAPLAYAAKFSEVVDRDWLKANGYSVAKAPHGNRYALFALGEKTSAAKLLSDPETEAFVCSTRWTGRIDADFYSRPLPSCGGKSVPNVFEKLRPYFKKWKSACAFNPVQMEFFEMIDRKELHTGLWPKFNFTDGYPIIDLFSGCGGMSLGFEMAGLRPVLAVEKDAWAAETYASNRTNVNVVTRDIREIASPRKQFPVGDVFGVVGGPPCQGFSVSGGRDPKDPRNSLFMDFMRFVRDFKPLFFIMENVPGILSSVTKAGEPVRDVILSEAKGIGYNVKVMLLDASNYGVPQSRHRVFFVGIREDWPFAPERLTPVMTTADCPITIRQALSDLPKIEACGGHESMAYGTPPENDYQRWCRRGSPTVENHVAMRHTQRLVARFHVIRYGESAADVPQEHRQRKRGNAAAISGKVYSQNNMRPYPDKPSPTIPASFQSNFVHPLFDRNYTAREGARLQSFPDSYVFHGRRTTMSWEKNLSQYQQIGNAVPPLLAKALGKMIIDYFTKTERQRGFLR